ncbi:hypothetical protein Caci_0753 [Catenulispora acidiphila DSM 44928]|uniref:Uncharacterized protein n=1 Tax=Catenulispora acidiphila (strain DSM 44928 / JCM 14897 / NBRC 102108 / NRRL B-24433 / ID139908) TaxID=479433 RepID=C7Q0R0_CATAD|nr:hypothetical protein Caci_0753 [Catenulispora acidiphila DSM 44928]
MVQGVPAACDGEAGAVVAACDAEVLPPVGEDDEDAGVDADAVVGLALDADVLPAVDGLAAVVPPAAPAWLEALLVQPAVSATVPSAPTAKMTEIRFMEPNLPGW